MKITTETDLNPKIKGEVFTKVQALKSVDVNDLMDMSVLLFYHTYKFLLKLRSTFYCQICDFKNSKHFKLKE